MSDSINRQILSELNLCRSDPKKYALKLKSTLKYYKGKIYEKPGRIPIETREGASNVEACISFLQGTRPFANLQWSNSLFLAAQAHVDDIGKLGLMGHTSSDGTEASERIGKFCKWNGALGENIDYGNVTAEDIVVSLLVDDGVLARGQRLNIMKRDHNFVGIAFGFHAEFETMCVVVFAEQIIEEISQGISNKSEEVLVNSQHKNGFSRVKLRKMRTKEAYETFDEKNYEHTGLSAKEINDIKAVFDIFDSDSAGTIDDIDIESILDNQEITDFSAFLKYTENEGKQNITFQDFLEIMTEKSITMSISDSEVSRFSDFSSIHSKSSAYPSSKLKSQEFNPQNYTKSGLSEEKIREVKKMYDIFVGYFMQKSAVSKLMTNKKDLQEISPEIIQALQGLSQKEVESLSFEGFLQLIAEKIKKASQTNVKKSYQTNYKNNNSKKTVKPFDPSAYERETLSREDILEIKDAFDMFDVDNNGTINPNELKTAMETQGLKTRNFTIFNMIANMHVSGHSKVNFDEFIELMTKDTLNEGDSVDEIRQLFRLFDVENTGFIELKNLKRIVKELGESLDERDMMELIKQSDLDGDGRVSFQDFYSIMNK